METNIVNLMGRTRIYQTNAERQAHYRKSLTKEQRQAVSNLDKLMKWKEENPNARQSTIKRNLERKRLERLSYPFIAIDGEGFTRLRKHYYSMLSSSAQHTIENWSRGLSTQECFEFLHRYSGEGHLVGFYTTYDVNMMLADLDLESLQRLWDRGETYWQGWHIAWMPAKRFQLRKDGKQVVWFDVFGFFQKSFIKALLDWGIDVPDEIIKGKENRTNFSKADKEKIKFYNLKECDLLVELMNKLRDAAILAGYVPNSWHGAGALANQILKQNGVDKHNVLDQTMRPRFLEAYYGGRNQVLQQGEFDKAYSHDINSAYPYSLTLLPTTNGVWRKVLSAYSINPYTLYKVQWKTPSKEYLNPFPFRFKNSIFWPNKGEGWYWQPEVEVAMEHYSKYIKILECHQFTPETEEKPFSFINDLFSTRRKFLSEGNDAQIIIKLGMNSCYGKVAQSIGYKGQPPAYQNYFWAGYITSYTRAQVLRLALKNKESVISFATDGVMASEKLADHNLTKQLGGWSVEPIENLFVLQPGVYCYDGSNHKQTIKSRGFSYRSVDYNILRKIWCEFGTLGDYAYSERRFVGLGAALQSNPPLSKWRRWIEQDRVINFAPNGLTTMQTGKTLRVYPHPHLAALSEAYKAKELWLPDNEFVSDLEQ